MHEVIKTVRTFAEMIEAQKSGDISYDALEKARTWMKEIITDCDYNDYIIELWRMALAQIGFENAKITFSGFWSQGDGANFTCDRVDIKKLALFLSTEREPKDHVEVIDGEEDFRSYLLNKIGEKGIDFNHHFDWIACFGDRFEASIVRTNYRYHHHNACKFRIEYHKDDEICRVLDSLEERAEELRKDLSKAIYRDLEENYYFQTADEALIEFGDTNGYTFDEFGAEMGSLRPRQAGGGPDSPGRRTNTR